jgi:hypothetical protein
LDSEIDCYNSARNTAPWKLHVAYILFTFQNHRLFLYSDPVVNAWRVSTGIPTTVSETMP